MIKELSLISCSAKAQKRISESITRCGFDIVNGEGYLLFEFNKKDKLPAYALNDFISRLRRSYNIPIRVLKCHVYQIQYSDTKEKDFMSEVAVEDYKHYMITRGYPPLRTLGFANLQQLGMLAETGRLRDLPTTVYAVGDKISR